jgi:hypothetical protein
MFKKPFKKKNIKTEKQKGKKQKKNHTINGQKLPKPKKRGKKEKIRA